LLGELSDWIFQFASPKKSIMDEPLVSPWIRLLRNKNNTLGIYIFVGAALAAFFAAKAAPTISPFCLVIVTKGNKCFCQINHHHIT
jgi:hypothetical protein